MTEKKQSERSSNASMPKKFVIKAHLLIRNLFDDCQFKCDDVDWA